MKWVGSMRYTVLMSEYEKPCREHCPIFGKQEQELLDVGREKRLAAEGALRLMQSNENFTADMNHRLYQAQHNGQLDIVRDTHQQLTRIREKMIETGVQFEETFQTLDERERRARTFMKRLVEKCLGDPTITRDTDGAIYLSCNSRLINPENHQR